MPKKKLQLNSARFFKNVRLFINRTAQECLVDEYLANKNGFSVLPKNHIEEIIFTICIVLVHYFYTYDIEKRYEEYTKMQRVLIDGLSEQEKKEPWKVNKALRLLEEFKQPREGFIVTLLKDAGINITENVEQFIAHNKKLYLEVTRHIFEDRKAVIFSYAHNNFQRYLVNILGDFNLSLPIKNSEEKNTYSQGAYVFRHYSDDIESVKALVIHKTGSAEIISIEEKLVLNAKDINL